LTTNFCYKGTNAQQDSLTPRKLHGGVIGAKGLIVQQWLSMIESQKDNYSVQKSNNVGETQP
jgi:hypothetical protein